MHSVADVDLIEDRYYRDSLSLKHNLSFAGCGFLGLYHIGVCSCIKRFAPHLYQNKPVSGTSAGALAAACLVCDLDIDECVRYLCRIIENARQFTLGPFDPRFKISEYLKDGLIQLLPQDAHVICSDRLSISLTCFATGKNIVVRKYKSKDELIQALLCSAYIPVFSGFVPLTFRGQLVIDGGLSDNLLNINQQTIKVSPFAGDSDICPLESKWGPQYHRDQPQKYEDVLGSISLLNLTMSFNLTNIKRLVGMVWPMTPDQLVNLTNQGYDDALRFLITRGFIACRIHQTPRGFSNISRIKSRNSLRIHRLHSCTSLASHKTDNESGRSKNLSDESNPVIKMVKSTRSTNSIPKKPIYGSGVGLNVAHCCACRNELYKAVNSCLPSSLHSLIRDGTKVSSVIFKFHSKSYLDTLEQSHIGTYHLLSLLDLLEKSHLYLETSKTVKQISTELIRKTMVMPTNPVTKKSYHRCPTIRKGADRLVGLILRLNSFELPSAKDCGLELLSHSLQKNMSSPCLLHMGDLESDVSQTDYGCKVENEDSGICNTPIHSVLTKKSLSIDNLDIDSSASYSAFEI
ncbi:Patatin-like phospholipase domain-containing protein 2 [Schistosoma japonicum]|nr:Patatin-like phospholipase domain-containing protein 2 [Schistosoma japonicum]